MFRLIYIFFIGIFLSSNILAKENDKIANVYFKDNYGVDDNSSSFKVYGLWSIISNKEADWPSLPVDLITKKTLLSESNQKDLVDLIDYGFGAGASFTTFFSDYIGVEFGVSGILYKINKDELSNVQFNYTNKDNTNPPLLAKANANSTTNPVQASTGSTDSTESTDSTTQNKTNVLNNNVQLIDSNSVPPTLSSDTYLYSIPLHATLQFHVAPFGGIRPYIGGGYHVNYVYSPLKEIDIDFMHGPIIQAGIDFVGKDNTIYNIDIKKYFVTSTKINYSKDYFGSSAFSTKTNFSPIIISLGIGMKF